MFKKLIAFKLFFTALLCAMAIVLLKYGFHLLNWEPIEQSSLHNGVLSSATFVIGFLLSATIADYKESERIPAEFAANIEDMYAAVSYTHLRAHETVLDLVCRLLLEKKKHMNTLNNYLLHHIAKNHARQAESTSETLV